MKTVLYIHGKGGSPDEAGHYLSLFPDCRVVGFPYRATTPWDAEREFPDLYRRLTEGAESVTVIANSIGAYFALLSLGDCHPDRMFLISPIVEMEKMILAMLGSVGRTVSDLRLEGRISTPFGETLTWLYLTYAKKHRPRCFTETHILYGENDRMTPLSDVREFAERNAATLSVMKGGEHWFHTESEMRFLDEWIRFYTKT